MNRNTKGSSKGTGESQRQSMVASTIKKLVATAIITKNLGAVGLKSEIVNVVDVKISPDLKNAKIFISVIGEENECQQQLQIVQSLGNSIQLLIARNLNLRYAPKISVGLDRSTSVHIRINELLAK